MKITIIGRGNAGSISAMHFGHFRKLLKQKVEIELIYDSKILPVPTGQGTTLDFSQQLFQTFCADIVRNNFPFTIKTGTMYENFGKKHKEWLAPFPLGSYALHFEPTDFANFVCENLKINFQVKDENIENLDSIDSDYIIDCRGKSKSLENYDKLINPLNCALLANLPKKENDVLWTRAIAHKNGWCFYIPLPEKTSIGYLFNKDLCSVEDAENDFKKMFDLEKINRVFPFEQYLAKEPIIDDRVFLNGNRLFFLEPLEATAMASYIRASQYYFGYIFEGVSKEETIRGLKDYVYKVQNFILWHYANGSAYDTPFWDYAKNLWENNQDKSTTEYIEIAKKMSSDDIERSIHMNDVWAQWKLWNFKNWLDGVNL